MNGEVRAMLAGLDMVQAAMDMRAEECVRAFKPLATMGQKPVSRGAHSCRYATILTGGGWVHCSLPVEDIPSRVVDCVDVKPGDCDDCPAWKAR